MSEIKKINIIGIVNGQKGFLLIDALITTLVILAIAGLLFFMGMSVQIQQQRAQHIVAVFLAQDYLNQIEYAIISNDTSLNLEKIKINYNDCDFLVKRQMIKNNEYSYTINVKIEWDYKNELQTEVQERIITTY